MAGFMDEFVDEKIHHQNQEQQRAPAEPATRFNCQGYPKRPGEEVCSFFQKNGTCTFASTCKWDHPEYIYPETDFNSLGFPLRPDMPDCEYYSKFRECKFGCTCKNNHPEMARGPKPFNGGAGIPHVVPKQSPLSATKQQHPQAPQLNRGPAIVMNQGPGATGLPRRPGTPACSFYMKVGSCKFGQVCKWDHPNRSGAAVAPVASQRSVFSAPTLMANGEHPIRPGQPPCAFFQKNGDCKFGATCKFDHSQRNAALPQHISQEPVQAPEPDAVNSKGFPIRDNSQPCSFFTKTGNCSYGPSCKWDHPEEFCHILPGETEQMENNFMAPSKTTPQSSGLPLRPGQHACVFYMKTGTCSFGATCKWDHPIGLGGTGVEGAGPGPQRNVAAAPRTTPY